MTDECEALLYAAARVQHLHDRVQPALDEGKLVICDRYVDSSFAYQAFARGLGEDFIGKINAFALENYKPDITIFIDLTPEEAFSRKKGADENDRLEKAGLAFHQRVYDGYKRLAENESNRIVSVNGRNTPEGIFEEILTALKTKGIL